MSLYFGLILAYIRILLKPAQVMAVQLSMYLAGLLFQILILRLGRALVQFLFTWQTGLDLCRLQMCKK